MRALLYKSSKVTLRKTVENGFVESLVSGRSFEEI